MPRRSCDVTTMKILQNSFSNSRLTTRFRQSEDRKTDLSQKITSSVREFGVSFVVSPGILLNISSKNTLLKMITSSTREFGCFIRCHVILLNKQPSGQLFGTSCRSRGLNLNVKTMLHIPVGNLIKSGIIITNDFISNARVCLFPLLSESAVEATVEYSVI